MHLSYVVCVLLSIAFLLAVPCEAMDSEVMTDVNGRIEQKDWHLTIDTLQSFSDAWNAHDLDKLMTFMSDDCEFHAVAGSEILGKSWFGKDEVRVGFSQAFITFPDAQWIDPVHFLMPKPNNSQEAQRGLTESTFVGTRTTPEGQHLRVEARMVDVFTFDDQGKIKVKNAFRKDRPPQIV